jgi:hypothetical protein
MNKQFNCIGHMFHKNCLLKHIIEEIIEGLIDKTERQKGCKLIMGELREMRGF